jgi:putative aldouronate transport system substrate-binding protein
MLRAILANPASRRSFVAGAAALGVSSSTLAAIVASAQTPVASPAGDVDPLVLGDDTVNGEFPLSDETVELTILIPSNIYVASFEDNAFTRWYEEKTNVHITWQIVPDEERDTALNLRLASGDYPDILMSFRPSLAVQELYGGQGTFLALNDYIEQHGVEFNRMVEQYPLTLRTITASDGNIYSLPYVNDCFHCAQDKKMWIYQPFLDALGMDMPQTTEEYLAYLRGCLEQDVNGNGEADELPLASGTGSWNDQLDLFFMNAFTFNPGEPYVFVDNGNVAVSYNQDGWRQGTAYLAGIYAEGLMDPESFTQNNEQLVAKGNSETPIVGSAPGGSWGVFVTWTADDPSGRWADFTLMPALEGPEGVRWSAYNPYLPYATGDFIITDRCENPDIAFRWADGLYDLETTLRSVQGELGVNWDWATPGQIGSDGQQAIWDSIPVEADSGEASSTAWVQTGPSYRSARVRFGEAVDDPAMLRYNLDTITKEVLEPYRQPAEMWIPPMSFTQDEAQVIAEAEATIVPFVQQRFAEWVTGNRDVDEDWESYLEELNGLGVETYIATYQQALERANEANQ